MKEQGLLKQELDSTYQGGGLAQIEILWTILKRITLIKHKFLSSLISKNSDIKNITFLLALWKHQGFYLPLLQLVGLGDFFPLPLLHHIP